LKEETMTMVGESSCTTNKVYKILMNILPALIAHLIHSGILDQSLSVVAIGPYSVKNSVGVSVHNELIAF
jgi:hypothetical protein